MGSSQKKSINRLGDAQGEETDFDRFVKDKMVHRLQMLRVALYGLTTDEKKIIGVLQTVHVRMKSVRSLNLRIV